MNEPMVFTVSEARKEPKLSRAKMYELVKSHKIFSVRAGRKILIPYKSLQEFLQPTQEERKE